MFKDQRFFFSSSQGERRVRVCVHGRMAAPPGAPVTRARVVWVLIDGVGDVGVPALAKQTPLQVSDAGCHRNAMRCVLCPRVDYAERKCASECVHAH